MNGGCPRQLRQETTNPAAPHPFALRQAQGERMLLERKTALATLHPPPRPVIPAQAGIQNPGRPRRIATPNDAVLMRKACPGRCPGQAGGFAEYPGMPLSARGMKEKNDDDYGSGAGCLVAFGVGDGVGEEAGGVAVAADAAAQRAVGRRDDPVVPADRLRAFQRHYR